ncbi:MAG: hypothetical protein KC736_02770 [Candidatus Moranbacteria bacterium]|nr:hypothetical protein [Candidatus Moranbacteria bacterium]
MPLKVMRFPNNPILGPNPENEWESDSVFNGSAVKEGNVTHFVYRAVSQKKFHNGAEMQLSVIGYTKDGDGVCYDERSPLVVPSEPWDAFGCEDPRMIKVGDEYWIFYTALANFPHTAEGIRVGLAITKDFKTIKEKHLVTPFNAKAMVLFETDGGYSAILTVDTDRPPSKVAVAHFSDKSQVWSQEFWKKWYEEVGNHTIPLQRQTKDHVEVGAAPIKTPEGLILVYSYIRDYRTEQPIFAIEAVLLETNQPQKIIGFTPKPLLVPEEEYELEGKVPNIVFPSSVFVEDGDVHIFYGGADTVCARAQVSLGELVAYMIENPPRVMCERFENNPLISPSHNKWESKYTFNPAAIDLCGKVHVLYRAMGDDDTSTIGYAVSDDGFQLTERLQEPIYTPRKNFEKKKKPGFSGCEDARLSQIGDRIYMCYTAYNAVDPARVAITSISVKNFCNREWVWDEPKIISPPDEFDKNSCVLSEKIGKKYVFFHRMKHCIWVDYRDTLDIPEDKPLGGSIIMNYRPDMWDSEKVGIAGPPMKISETQWLLIYHGVSKFDWKYRLGAAILDMSSPGKETHRLPYAILEPEEPYENSGYRPGTVFACGSVERGENILVYYGGADQYVCGAFINKKKLLDELKKYPIK